MHTMTQVFARRLGRIAFGAALLVGLGVLTTSVFHAPFGRHDDSLRSGEHPANAARIIATTWVIAFLAAGAVRVLASRLRWSRAPDALFAPSVVIPTAGIALLLPITLHMPVVLAIAGFDGFDFWVAASMAVTGLAHLAFTVLSVARASQLVAGRPATTPRQIYVVTLIASCVPFIILWGIPPLLVGVTALPFVPMLHAMRRLVERERTYVAAVTQALPRAIAAPRRA